MGDLEGSTAGLLISVVRGIVLWCYNGLSRSNRGICTEYSVALYQMLVHATKMPLDLIRRASVEFQFHQTNLHLTICAYYLHV